MILERVMDASDVVWILRLVRSKSGVEREVMWIMARAKLLVVAGADLVRELLAENMRSMRETNMSIVSPVRILVSASIDSSSAR